tara:strand:+ start:12990 stop:14699 length:1710 start_codon:yes stop_codon:yes gene_type:complete
MSVIGQGTYGCVHKPSLKCNTTEPVDYTDKVSKILIKKEATKEIQQYSILKKIDPKEKHYLGMPIKCQVKKNKENIRNIKKCKYKENFLGNLDNTRLLVMKDGGNNIHNIFKNVLPMKSREEQKITSELIILYLLNVFNTLKFFNKKKVSHRDIKSENIIFNTEKQEIQIVDFGLMHNYNHIKIISKSNANPLTSIWWSIPPYAIFMNKSQFEKIKNIDISESKFKDFLKEEQISSGEQIDYFYKIISKNALLDISELKINLFKQFHNTMEKSKNISHDKYLDLVVPLLDNHNMGIVLLHTLSYAKKYIDNNSLLESIKSLGLKMINYDVHNHIDIDQATKEYKKILKSSGLIKKHNLHLQNNEIKEIRTKSSSIGTDIGRFPVESVIEKFNSNLKLVQSRTRKGPTKTVKFKEPTKNKTTPPGKMLNPKTGRYINIPKLTTNKTKRKTTNKDNEIKLLKQIIQTMNKNNKTAKNNVIVIKQPSANTAKKTTAKKTTAKKTTAKKTTAKKTTLKKKTPPGKMLNPKTGRYINIPKSALNKTKKCPPGKVLNPKTNRCVDEFKKKRFIFF